MTPAAYEYDGSQEAYHTFTARVGKTPKHSARDWLQKGLVSPILAPTGRVKDTIEAMLGYWVMRQAQWNIACGSWEKTSKCWFADEYGIRKLTSEAPDPDDDHSVNHLVTADGLVRAEIGFGPPGHECLLELSPEGSFAAGFQCKIVELEMCHPDYAASQKLVVLEIQRWASVIPYQLGYPACSKDDMATYDPESGVWSELQKSD